MERLDQNAVTPAAESAASGAASDDDGEQGLRWEVAGMNRLQELSTRLVAAPDFQAVLTETMHAAIELLRADFGSTQLYDPASNTLKLVAHRNFKPEVVDYFQTVTLEHGSACAMAVAEGGRIILEDLLAEPRCAGDFAITRIAGWRGVQSTPLRARDGKLLGMVSTHWRHVHRPSERELRILDLYSRQAADMIERMQTQEALYNSEQRFAAIFNQAAGGIACADLSGRFTMVNDRYCRMVGRPCEELVGMHIRDVTHPDDVAAKMALLERVLKGETAATFDQRYVRPDGSIVWASVDIVLTRDAAGKPLATIATYQDVTERKLAEEALRQRTAQYEALFNDAPLGMYLVDSQLRMREVNPTARPIFGDIPDLIGHDFDQLLHILWPKDFADEIVQRFRRTLETGEPHFVAEDIERRVDRKALEHYEWQIHRIPLPEGGYGVVCYFRDISAWVLVREALRESQERLREANAHLEQRVAERTSDLLEHQRQLRRLTIELTRTEQAERRRLANLLHDHLQQLLVAAKMRLEQARGKAQLQRVKDPLDSCADLLKQSIEASRSLTAQLSPPVLYDAGLAPALAWLARWMQDQHDMTVGLDLDPAAEPQTEDVRVMLFEATRELLFNTAKHAGVDEAAVSMAVAGDGRLKLTVADRGRGFDGEALAATRDERGLGLLHTRERLRYIGGDMIITSSPGEGTRVELIAPIRIAADELHHAQAAPLAAGSQTSTTQAATAPAKSGGPNGGRRPIRVLIADDHQIMRQGLASLLIEDPEIEVIGEACDGEAAVEMSDKLQPDVVIMDVAMPRLNGIEATRRIKLTRPEVRVIGLSMHDESAMAASLRDAGAAAYLTKGGPSAALVSAIKQ